MDDNERDTNYLKISNFNLNQEIKNDSGGIACCFGGNSINGQAGDACCCGGNSINGKAGNACFGGDTLKGWQLITIRTAGYGLIRDGKNLKHK